MKIKLILFLLTICIIINAQKKIHVQYINVRSEVATINEDLYVLNGKVISIQDSVFQSLNVHNVKLYNPNKIYYISDVKNVDSNYNPFFFNKMDRRNNQFFIYDQVPTYNWNIDKKNSKKILGYQCYKATAEFRGSKIIAYFTYDIPIPVGPFKFFGLPGLILEVKEENKSFDIWKAKFIDFNYSEVVNFKPEFSKASKLSMKNFWEIEQENSFNEQKEMQQLFPNSQITSEKPNEIEDKFEWE